MLKSHVRVYRSSQKIHRLLTHTPELLHHLVFNHATVNHQGVIFKGLLSKLEMEDARYNVPPVELERYLQSVPKGVDAAVIPSFLGLMTYCEPIGCYGGISLHSSSITSDTRSSPCRPISKMLTRIHIKFQNGKQASSGYSQTKDNISCHHVIALRVRWNREFEEVVLLYGELFNPYLFFAIFPKYNWKNCYSNMKGKANVQNMTCEFDHKKIDSAANLDNMNYDIFEKENDEYRNIKEEGGRVDGFLSPHCIGNVSSVGLDSIGRGIILDFQNSSVSMRLGNSRVILGVYGLRVPVFNDLCWQKEAIWKFPCSVENRTPVPTICLQHQMAAENIGSTNSRTEGCLSQSYIDISDCELVAISKWPHIYFPQQTGSPDESLPKSLEKKELQPPETSSEATSNTLERQLFPDDLAAQKKVKKD
ncbi:hypothetical protein Tco_1377412 [Tanacetum coccineum]